MADQRPVLRTREAAAEVTARPSPPLRRILVVVDAAALAIAWLVAEHVYRLGAGTAASPNLNVALFTIVGTGAGLFLMAAAGLYRRRVCQVRSVEVARIVRVAAAMAVIAGLRSTGVGADTAIGAALATALTLILLLSFERAFFREWIAGRRAGGDFRAPVVVIGAGVEAHRMADFLQQNPVLGFNVLGVAGPDVPIRGAFPSLGDVGEIEELAVTAGASGVVVDAGSLTGYELNDTVHRLSHANLHVHVTSGLRGVDWRRITVSPLADETVLHIAPTRLSRQQEVAKRLLDVTLSSMIIVVGAPVLLLVGAAIWLGDRGPVFFRQTRVGQDGEHFTVYKFRTMVLDAEARLDDLQEGNVRVGPLFKLVRDPRVTPVGRFLRATSLDELPQLFNVLEGTMSLVGPRPALPSEAADFDDELLTRVRVKPGVTGLWQVEARDLASFDLYRRYDLLYVESWSLALDLAIIGRTVFATFLRAIRTAFSRGAW